MPFVSTTALDRPVLNEQQDSFAGGMDEYTRASQLRADQFIRGINTLVTDNFTLKTRPGADSLGADAAGANPVQGIFYFDKPGGEYLLRCVNGVFTKRTTLTLAAAWTAEGSWTANTSAKLAAAQLVEKLYVTDGDGNWRSFDGSGFTDLGSSVGTAGSPPVGATIATAHSQRLFGSGVAASPDTVWASGLLAAGTSDWDHVNFKFRVGHGEGDAIRGMVSLQNFNLLFLKEGSIWLCHTPPTAASANDFSISRMPGDIGVVGKRAYVAVGNDVMFLAQDGVRSIRRMESSGEQYEISPPLSLPLQPWIDRINWAYADLSCAFRYEHLVGFAVPIDSATAPSHVLVWNERLNCWNGVWTGWTPRQFCVSRFSGLDRLVVGDNVGRVNLWKDTDDESTAATFTDNSSAVPTTMRMRGMVFGEPNSKKSPDYWEARFVETGNTVMVALYFDETLDYGPNSYTLPQYTVTLPVVLPFTLGSLKPRDIRRRVLNGTSFREATMEISATGGKVAVRSFSLGAFLRPLLRGRSDI